MQVFDMMVKILLTYAGKPLSPIKINIFLNPKN